MALRDKLNENPGITTGVTIAILVIFIVAIFYSMSGSSTPTPQSVSGRQFYFTDDDGAHYFGDDASKIPPIDHNGKPAVRARVFKSGGKEFVNHLERYTPEGKKKAEAFYAKPAGSSDPTLMESIQRNGMEVKAPGQKDWVKLSDPRAMSIMQPKPPGGGSGDDLEEVYP